MRPLLSRRLPSVHQADEHSQATARRPRALKRAGKWYAERYGNRSPLTCAWSKTAGFEIGGILNPQELHDLIDRSKEAVNRPRSSAAA